MQEIMLVNPSRRRRRRKSNPRHKRRRSHHVSRRRRNPFLSLPRKRHRRRTRHLSRRIMRRRRRNPIRMGGVMSAIVPAFKGALGAAGTDVAYRFLPTPGALAMLKGPLAPITKVAVAFGVGWLASMFGGRSLGRDMTSGALVVIAYDFLNANVLSRLPAIGTPVGEYISGLGYQATGRQLETDYYGLPDYSALSEQGEGMGEYISGMTG